MKNHIKINKKEKSGTLNPKERDFTNIVRERDRL